MKKDATACLYLISILCLLTGNDILYQMLKVCFKLYNLSAAPKPDHDSAFDDVAGECIATINCMYLLE